MLLASGEKLGSYEIVAPLGAGGSQPLEMIVNWPALLKKGIAGERYHSEHGKLLADHDPS